LHGVKPTVYVFVEGDTVGDARADLRVVADAFDILSKSDFIL